ncbi:MAG: hypothetical protein ACI8P9_000482 [Parasphingorhabdus sp.]|jgi:hypothetical protein
MKELLRVLFSSARDLAPIVLVVTTFQLVIVRQPFPNLADILVEEHLCRHILETLSEVGQFEQTGGGIAFKIDVEDAVGVEHQIAKLAAIVEEEI